MQHLSLPLVQVHQRCHLFFVDQRFALEIQSEDLDFVSERLKFGVVVWEYHLMDIGRLYSVSSLAWLAQKIVCLNFLIIQFGELGCEKLFIFIRLFLPPAIDVAYDELISEMIEGQL